MSLLDLQTLTVLDEANVIVFSELSGAVCSNLSISWCLG